VPDCLVCSTALPQVPTLRGKDLLHGGPGEFTVHECPRCGAGTTQPPLTPAELHPYYPDTYGPHSSNNRLVHHMSAALLRRECRVGAVGALRRTPQGRALDVGCGSGDLGALLVDHGWAVDGIDPSAAAVERAIAQGVKAVEGTLDTVELEPATYHAVIFHHSLEHVDDPVRSLQLAAKALRPGGSVLVTAPNFGCWARRRFGPAWFHLDLPRHRVHFTAESLRLALQQAGLGTARTWTSTSTTGLLGSVQYRLAGGLAVGEGDRREALGQAAALAFLPGAWVEQRLGGGHDFLHAVARTS
jgi:2-polyprenyl-3-methyl-5-hydroxy-6-metoxy-1,4-benzoquinol methylase